MPRVKLLIVILIIFLVTSVAHGMGHGLEKKVREDQAEVKTDRSPPIIADDNIRIKIKEAEGGANSSNSHHTSYVSGGA